MQESRQRQIQAGIRWDWLENDGGDFAGVRCKGGFDRRKIVEGQGDREFRQFLGHACAVRVAVGQRAAASFDQQRIDMAVVTAFELDDFIPTGEAAREADAAHRRLSAAVDHTDFFHRGHHAADRFRHFHLEGIRRAKTQSALGRLAHGFDHWLRCVAEDRRSPGADKIDKLPIFDSGEAASLGRLHKKRFAAHATKSPHGGVHAPGDSFFRCLEKLTGIFHHGIIHGATPRGNSRWRGDFIFLRFANLTRSGFGI